jgi:DNA-binding transcriptional regulator WhiA
MKRTLTNCLSCGGTGTAPLPDHLEEVLRIVRKNRHCTIPEIHKALGADITTNGVNNRVSDLLELGLLRKAGKIGKFFVYGTSLD